MPYVPDVNVSGTGGTISSIVDSGAAAAARAFAETMHALKAGYAFGFNITTSADRLPSDPFAPVFVNAAGISVAARVNGISWAFDASGLVASADMTLCGVAGATASVTSSWVRLPVTASGLPLLTTPGVNSNAKPANTVTVASNVDLSNTTSIFSQLPKNQSDTPARSQTVANVVAPFLVTEKLIARTLTRVLVVEYKYPVLSEDEISIETKTQVSITQVLLIEIPEVVVTAAAPLPMVSAGKSVKVPLSTTALTVSVPTVRNGASVKVSAVNMLVAQPVPTVRCGASVAVPATAISVQSHVPDTAGPIGIRLLVPATDCAVSAPLPVLRTGASIKVPAAAVQIAAPTPELDLQSDYYGSFIQQILGWDRDMQPDWWVE